MLMRLFASIKRKLANSLLNLPTSEGDLEEGNDARDEYHGGDDLTAGGVVVQHAQGRGEDERDAHDSTDHRQIVLKDKGGGFFYDYL